MTNQPSALRFDHREIAVIFSLFIFVSLLMFTVGIVVGKGLAQARFESLTASTRAAALPAAPVPQAPPAASTSLNLPNTTPDRLPAQAAAPAPEPKAAEPFKLIPKTPATAPATDPNTAKEAEALIRNPKIRALFETTPGTAKTAKKAVPKTEDDDSEDRKTTSIAPATVPPSFAAGPFTVQVGSYPTKTDAVDRINQLKEIGFPHAYLSVKKFGDGKEIWYRVWLGYYPDTEVAKKSGEYLQQRGEVNNYLIRKSDNPG